MSACSRLIVLAVLASALVLPVAAASAQLPPRGYVDDPSCPIPGPELDGSLQEVDGTPTFPRSWRMVFIPVDFPNAPAGPELVDAVRAGAEELAGDLEFVSQGYARAVVDVADQVYRLPQELSTAYLDGPQVLYDAIAAADPDVDFSTYDVVQVVPQQQTTGLEEASSTAYLDEVLPAPADGVERVYATTYATGAFIPVTVLHETLHLFGAPDLYDASSGELMESAVGGWSVMRGPAYDFVPQQGLLNMGWDTLRMGWMDAEQTTCVAEAGTTEVTLTPLADGDGVRLVRVPVGTADHVLLEYRVPSAADPMICGDGGVLAYVDDSTRFTTEGLYRVIDATPGSIVEPPEGDEDPCREDVDDGAFQPGPQVDLGTLDPVAQGVSIEVRSVDGGRAVVSVTRDTEAMPVDVPASDPFALDQPGVPRTGAEGTPVNQAWEVSTIRFGDDRAGHVVVARGDDFADALAGTSLLRDGPMLLLNDTVVMEAFVREELDRVLPAGGQVYLLGGVNAVDQSVEDDLRAAGYVVDRLQGGSRIETSVAIADRVRSLYGTGRQVLLARAFGEGTAAWADAVTAGGAAARYTLPVVLTPTEGLADAVAGIVAEAEQVAVVGGTAALSEQVQADVAALGAEPVRVAGSSRDTPAAAVATMLWSADRAARYVLIDGYGIDGWATGLPAAGLSADFDAPLLVTTADQVPPGTVDLLAACTDDPLELLLHASTTQVGEQVRTDLAQYEGTCA